MENGKQYLIMKKLQNNDYTIKLAYWFDERIIKKRIYPKGFYRNKYSYYPHENVTSYIDMDKIPKFTLWKMEDPIEGEKYLVYRVGSSYYTIPHYTIRKYHNGSFGSADVKYWMRLEYEKLFNL